MRNIILLAFCLFSASLFGQSAMQIEKEAQPIIKLYKMDDNQAQQYISILKVKSKGISDTKTLKSTEKEEALEAVELAYEKSFLGILNDDQKKIFESQKALADGIKNKKAHTLKK